MRKVWSTAVPLGAECPLAFSPPNLSGYLNGKLKNLSLCAFERAVITFEFHRGKVSVLPDQSAGRSSC